MGCCTSSDDSTISTKRQELYSDQQQQQQQKQQSEADKKKVGTSSSPANQSTDESKKESQQQTATTSPHAHPAVPKQSSQFAAGGSSLNSRSSIAQQSKHQQLSNSQNASSNSTSLQQQICASAFGANTMTTAMTHKCSDYLPGMQGNFICDAFCQQRSEEDGGTIWGGGEDVAIELVPFAEQMKENKNEYTAAAFKALMNSESENKQPRRKIYAAASCVCRAALHAGAISNEPDENGEQQPRSFCVVALARKSEDAAALKAPLNDYEARGRYVKHGQSMATLPEVQGALLVKKDWPAATVNGSVTNGVESYDVSNVVSQWVCFV